MSYSGYVRTFHDYDGKTRVVVKEATNLKAIEEWIRPTANPTKRAEGLCPKCGRPQSSVAVSHNCPS